jgi:hypothetical protein
MEIHGNAVCEAPCSSQPLSAARSVNVDLSAHADEHGATDMSADTKIAFSYVGMVAALMMIANTICNNWL